MRLIVIIRFLPPDGHNDYSNKLVLVVAGAPERISSQFKERVHKNGAVAFCLLFDS
jgi:hypothetical protein